MFFHTLTATVEMNAYVVARTKAINRDRTLPEKGVVRTETGRRRGRDGRLVEREARYDPRSDIAYEKVVDVETGDVIVDKTESMKAKYMKRGRWRPPAHETDTR
jgi:hypothetical protein